MPCNQKGGEQDEHPEPCEGVGGGVEFEVGGIGKRFGFRRGASGEIGLTGIREVDGGLK